MNKQQVSYHALQSDTNTNSVCENVQSLFHNQMSCNHEQTKKPINIRYLSLPFFGPQSDQLWDDLLIVIHKHLTKKTEFKIVLSDILERG